MMTIETLRLCALTAAFSGSAVPSLADVVWNGDPARSNVMLSVSHLLVAKITGTIPIASATIVTTDGAVVPLSVNAILDASRLDTHDPKRDAELRSDRFFDVARYRTISFASEQIVPTGAQSFAIDGELSMRGVTRAMRLEGRVVDVEPGKPGERRVRYLANGTFRRSDYGMAYARGIVGNDVRLSIEIEAINESR